MKPASANFFEFGKFRLDAGSRVLLNGDNSVVEITPKALEILCLLVENAGQVVSKEEIFKKVWSDRFVEEANLSHHIFRLRKALGETEAHEFIETVPKRGYRFVANLKEPETQIHDSQIHPGPIGGRKIFVGLAVVLLLVLTGFLIYRVTRPNNQTNTQETSIESIAVMPFQNESGNAELEYLSDGMTESLISSLSQIPKLKVKARSSVFHFKGKEVSPNTVGTELNVEAILNGRIIQRGDDLTLYLSLIETKTENQIWGKQYNRKLINLVTLQTEIARDVSNSLKTKLSGADEQRLAKKYTENAEAYRLYLKGRFYWNKFTGDTLKKSVDYFEQAIAIDKDYALAYAGLADSYNVLGINGHQPVKIVLPKGKSAAEKAVALDDQLAEAHSALGAVKLFWEWDFPGAERELKRAMELDPNFSIPYELYGYLLRSQRRFDEALIEMRKAQELDPLSLLVGGDIGETLRCAGRTAEAIEEQTKVLEMDPNYTDALYGLGLIYIDHGMPEKALEQINRAIVLSNNATQVRAVLGQIYAVSGKKAEANKIINELLGESRYVSPLDIAMIYARLGENDRAIFWLEKAYEEHSCWLIEINAEPAWEKIRSDSRFQDLMRRIGLEK